jgi:hypothetical protein
MLEEYCHRSVADKLESSWQSLYKTFHAAKPTSKNKQSPEKTTRCAIEPERNHALGESH